MPHARAVRFESLEARSFSADEAARLAVHASHEIRIEIGERTVAVRFSRASAAELFASRFGDMLGTGVPDATLYAVTCGGEAFFWMTPDRVRCWPAEPSDELLVFFADNTAIHEFLISSDALGIHAAVIATASHLIALVGESTAGKTTTAVAAVRSGLRLYSDERCIIAGGRVFPFLRAMTLRAGGRAALLAAEERGETAGTTRDAFPSGDDVELRPRVLAGDRAGGPPRPLDAIFVIDGRDSTPRVAACSRYDVVPALGRSVICRDSGVERVARLLREFRAVRTFRLCLGSPHRTVEAIEAALQ